MEIRPVRWVRSLSIPKMSVFLIPPDRISTISAPLFWRRETESKVHMERQSNYNNHPNSEKQTSKGTAL